MMQQSNGNLDAIVKSVYVAMPRAVVTFVLGHPFDLLKTRMQADMQSQSAWNMAVRINQRKSIFGFYQGGSANFSRTIIKEAYRTPARGALLAYFTALYPATERATRSVLTSFAMAVLDSIIVAPLERLKVWTMTSAMSEKRLIKCYLLRTKKSHLPLYRDLYKGTSASLLRSTVSWCSYLVPESIIRDEVSRRYGHNGGQVTLSWNCAIGCVSGIINGLCTLPIDTIKTQVQQEAHETTVSVRSMVEIGRKLVNQHGITGLYRGFCVRLLHYSMIGAITGNVIAQVDAIWGVR